MENYSGFRSDNILSSGGHMKRCIYLLMIISLLAFPGLLYSQNKPVITLYDMTKANGTRETFSITEQTAVKVPEWSPEKSDTPPLSITRAVTLAKEWAKKHGAKDNKTGIGSIKMERINWPEINNRWYYLIELTHILKGHTTSGEAINVTTDPTFVVVLMDGTTVAPVISGRHCMGYVVWAMGSNLT